MSRLSCRWTLLYSLMAIVIAADQISKEIVVQNLRQHETVVPIPFLEDVFRFTHSYNTGAAFGLGSNFSDLFLVLAIGIVIVLLWYYPRIPANGTLTRIGVALVCGGVLGNVIDRLRHGHVTDFIHYEIPDLISNVSNLADHAIVIGVLIIVFDSFRLENQAKAVEETPIIEGTTQTAESAYNESDET